MSAERRGEGGAHSRPLSPGGATGAQGRDSGRRDTAASQGRGSGSDQRPQAEAVRKHRPEGQALAVASARACRRAKDSRADTKCPQEARRGPTRAQGDADEATAEAGGRVAPEGHRTAVEAARPKGSRTQAPCTRQGCKATGGGLTSTGGRPLCRSETPHKAVYTNHETLKKVEMVGINC